jgi:3-oxoacyl-[acyl-carrier protein] reductase
VGFLENKVAIVTGASSGIGQGIAERLGAEGAAVVVNYFGHDDRAAETVRLIEAAGGRAVTVQGDVRRADDVQNLFEQCIATFGRPDVLVNNAGMGVLQPLADADEETYDRIYGLNCKGTLFCLKQASLHLNDEGRIVNIASSSAVYPWPNAALYASSKAAVQKLTEIAAVELGSRRINVNCVIPGITRTPMSAALPAAATEPVAAASPWKRIGTPEDIAAVVAFFCGPDSHWVTGQALLANGGSGH